MTTGAVRRREQGVRIPTNGTFVRTYPTGVPFVGTYPTGVPYAGVGRWSR
jgi:hypothetical protein